MLWTRQTTLWVYTMCLFFHIQRDEFYSWLATKASVKCVVLRAVKRRLSVVRVFSFSEVFCRTTRKRKPAVYSLKERHDSHRPTCQRVYGVSYILLLISQWSATQGAWYILTGLAGVARPATTAVAPTSPPLYFNTKFSVVRRDARLPQMTACRCRCQSSSSSDVAGYGPGRARPMGPLQHFAICL